MAINKAFICYASLSGNTEQHKDFDQKYADLIHKFTEKGWEAECVKGYLPEAHFMPDNDSYQQFTGGKITFFKKQIHADISMYGGCTFVEVFPTVDGLKADYYIEAEGEGLSFDFNEADKMLGIAENWYKDHHDQLKENKQ